MFMRWRGSTASMSWIAGIFLLVSSAESAEQEPSTVVQNIKRLTILQMNDSHAYLELHQEMFPGPGKAVYRPAGGYARIAALVKEIRAEVEGRLLFCDGGDTFYGTYPAQKSRGQVMVPVLNALGIAAMTPHWEFVFGPKRFRELADQLNFPVLAINIYDKETGKRPFPPYSIKEVSGLRIALAGIASNIVDKTMPPAFSEGLRFTLGKEELPVVIQQLREQEKVDLVVLISHLGFPQDMRLLAEVPGVDICLSGHTHNRLYWPAKQGKTLVIQSGCHGSFLGRLDLEVANGEVVRYQHRLIEVAADVQPDPTVEAIIQEQLLPYRSELSETVGETSVALNRGTILEATTDNLLLQAMLETTGADMAFSNGWRYGAPVVPGPVTLNDLYNVVPINPPISTVRLTGQELLAMLEENLEHTFSADPYQQMGGYVKRCLGITIHVTLENPPGYRIQKLYVGQDAVEPDRLYAAAFITEQGVPAKYGRDRQHQPEHIVDAMRTYLSKHRPADTGLQGTFIAE